MRESRRSGALTETTFLILLAACRPIHGYGMMQFIERETAGRVLLGAGTLYGAIQTLLKRGWIEPVTSGGGGARTDYIITELGREITAKEQKRIAELSQLAKRIARGNTA